MENALIRLQSKLNEIFRLDKNDLDFGIYRILNSKNKQINQFINETLPNKARQTLSSESDVNSVFSHLLQFFKRYYKDGDFVNQAITKVKAYHVPYNGQETVFHWANKGQYYIKSGERFSSYRFKIQDKTIEFKVVEASTAKDNIKVKKRLYLLDTNPLETNDNYQTVRFNYIPTNEFAKQADANAFIIQSLQANKELFAELLTLSPTEKNKTRTILEKHLTTYTAKNSFDFFIHKDLKGFLNNELDNYIKTELFSLDNLQDIEADQLSTTLKTVKSFQELAKSLIDLLTQIEEFQKSIYLKKKFVTNQHYLITLDKIQEKHHQTIFNNQKQLKQWQDLYGYEINEFKPFLPVDTSLFDKQFEAELIAEIHNLDAETTGVLINADNYQALNLLKDKHREQIKCIYIDPPYNTGNDSFIYKDSYQHSSWLSFMSERLSLAKELLSPQGVMFQSIDDNEQSRLKILNDAVFGEDNFVENYIWHSNFRPDNSSSIERENGQYILCYAKNKCSVSKLVGQQKRTEGLPSLTKNKSNISRLFFKKEWVDVRLQDGLYKAGELKSGYILHNDVRVSNGVLQDDFDLSGRVTWSQSYLENEIKKGTKIVIKTSGFVPYVQKVETSDLAPTTIIPNEEVGDVLSGNSDLNRLFDVKVFTHPKPISLLKYLLNTIIYNGFDSSDIILDFFAGSGTTAHATLNLNKEDNGNRKFILVEQGEYFDTVLKPRIAKATFATKYKDGIAQDEQGISQIIKILKLESYEDALNNLETNEPAALLRLPELQDEYFLNYMLEVESKESRLSVQHFKKPFDYQLNIATNLVGEFIPTKIDLVETFIYLIGMQVIIKDDKSTSRGYVRIEGTIKDRAVLVIFRNEEVDLRNLLDKLHINEKDSEFAEIYVNGDNNLEGSKIKSIEAEFLAKMWG